MTTDAAPRRTSKRREPRIGCSAVAHRDLGFCHGCDASSVLSEVLAWRELAMQREPAGLLQHRPGPTIQVAAHGGEEGEAVTPCVSCRQDWPCSSAGQS